jgi:hypothetical protein
MLYRVANANPTFQRMWIIFFQEVDSTMISIISLNLVLRVPTPDSGKVARAPARTRFFANLSRRKQHIVTLLCQLTLDFNLLASSSHQGIGLAPRILAASFHLFFSII